MNEFQEYKPAPQGVTIIGSKIELTDSSGMNKTIVRSQTYQLTSGIKRTPKHSALSSNSFIEMSEKNFTCKLANREVSCGPPGCICIQMGPDEIDCRCIGDIYKTTPDSSKDVSEIDEFIDKVKYQYQYYTLHYKDGRNAAV